MGHQFYRKYTTDEIKDAFRYFDKDGSGFISADELQEVMAKMGRNYSKEEIKQMIRSVGKLSHNTHTHTHATMYLMEIISELIFNFPRRWE